MFGRVKGNVLKLRGAGVWAPVSKGCTNSGVLDAGHLIPEFAFSVLGLWRETDHGSL